MAGDGTSAVKQGALVVRHKCKSCNWDGHGYGDGVLEVRDTVDAGTTAEAGEWAIRGRGGSS